MKLKVLIILLIFTSCQLHRNSLSSYLSEMLKKASHPTLLALQFLTVEMKDDNGDWAESVTDYKYTYGDSVDVLFSEFTKIQFKLLSDTLLILYKLRDPLRVTNFDVEFVDPQLYTASAKVKFESEAKAVNNKNLFEADEGSLLFFKESSHVSVIHEYQGGVSRNKMTSAQQ